MQFPWEEDLQKIIFWEPVSTASGISEGGKFGEASRKSQERQMLVARALGIKKQGRCRTSPVQYHARRGKLSPLPVLLSFHLRGRDITLCCITHANFSKALSLGA